MSSTPAPPRQLALIVNVGTSDIKYWRTSDRGPVETKLDADATNPATKRLGLRDIHKLLLSERDAWRFATIEDARIAQSQSTASELSRALDGRGGVYDCGKLLLSPAKVATIAGALAALRDEFKVRAIVVVHTERKQSHPDQHLGEPIASGPLILEYLCNTLDVQADTNASLINAIQDSGRLEGDQDNGADFPTRRDVAHWLERGLDAFVNTLGEDARHIEPVLLNTGGMAPIKDLLRSIVALRFHKAPRDLSTPEGRINDPKKLVSARLNADSPVISRHEAIDARARALYLVRRGDFPGAWAAVSQFQGSEADQWWLQPLHEVARYFGAAPGAPPKHAPAHPDPVIASVQKRVSDALSNARLSHRTAIDQHKAFTLNAAFRLEAALQGDNHDERRFADALSAVCTLIDTLVVARAMQLLHDKGPTGQRACQVLGVSAPDIETGNVAYNDEGKYKGECRSDGSCLKGKRIHSGCLKGKRIHSDLDAWFKLVHMHLPSTDWFDAVHALDTALKSPPHSKSEAGRHLRTLRNDSAHRALSTDDIARIRELGEAHRIWRYRTTEPGQHALAPADAAHGWPGLVDAALGSIGIADAADQYRQLVQGLSDLLQAVEPAPDTAAASPA